jgi:hypothetical protein
VTEIKAHPIIDDSKQDLTIVGRKLYLHVLGLAVLNYVMQRFLRDAI